MIGGGLRNKARTALWVSVGAGLAISTPAALGAIYEVHACRLPNGAGAPANGWTPTTGAIASVDCPGGKMTVRTPPGAHSPGWRYGLSFSAPPGTNIAGFRRYVEVRIVQVLGGPPPWWWNYFEAGTVVGEDQLTGLRASSNPRPYDDDFEYPLTQRLSRVQFSLECADAQNAGPCQENGSSFSLRRIAVQLDDTTPPTVLASSGSLLAAASPQRGERHLELKLRDVGSGLYRVRVDVDGDRMSELPVDENQGACKSPFVLPVPCKLAATVDVPVDTTRLSEGRHTILVRVFDATGVNAAAVGPLSLEVDNAPDPPPRGTSACPQKNVATVRGRLRTKVLRFGHSALIVGRVSTRTSLGGARVGVVDNPLLKRRPGLARVRRGGRFHIRVRPTESTKIRPILVSARGVAQACGKPLKLSVRAGVRLATTPRHLRNGQSIRMDGRVSGRGIPQHGKTVAIQARARGAGSWTTVTLMRSDSVGRFHFKYRFRKTFRVTTYEFRAVAPRERGYPYVRGWSRGRRATVSP
jgi:hypothetical protein